MARTSEADQTRRRRWVNRVTLAVGWPLPVSAQTRLEAEADTAGRQMVGRPAEAGRPRAGRSMSRIRGGAKNPIHVADIQVAVLAKQVSAAVAEGEARTGLCLRRKGPG